MALTARSTPHTGRRLAVLSCVLGIASMVLGCNHRPTQEAGASSTRFIVVRHAEKATPMSDSDKDPALTDAGHERAARLARSLDDAGVVAVYATPYKRTRQTAEPTALAQQLPITEYDARGEAAVFAGALRERHRAGTVLVVGHSNTVPDIVAALCGCEVAPMTEAEYDHRFIVDITANGEVAMVDSPLAD
jgi:phosphohistidine phosphatase SixA